MVNRLHNHGNKLNTELQQIYQALNNLMNLPVIKLQSQGGSKTPGSGVTKAELQALNVAFTDEQNVFSVAQHFNNTVNLNSTVNKGAIGPFTVNSIFNITGGTTFTNIVIFLGNINQNSGNTATFNSPVTFTDDITQNSGNTATFNSPVTFTGNITQNSGNTATFNSPVTIAGVFTVNANYTFNGVSSTINTPLLIVSNSNFIISTTSSFSVNIASLFLGDSAGHGMNGQSGEVFNSNDVLRVVSTSPFKFGFRP